MAEYLLPCGKCWQINTVEAEQGTTVEWLCVFCDNKSMREVTVKLDGANDKQMVDTVSPNVSEVLETTDGGIVVKQAMLEGTANVSSVGK